MSFVTSRQDGCDELRESQRQIASRRVRMVCRVRTASRTIPAGGVYARKSIHCIVATVCSGCGPMYAKADVPSAGQKDIGSALGHAGRPAGRRNACRRETSKDEPLHYAHATRAPERSGRGAHQLAWRPRSPKAGAFASQPAAFAATRPLRLACCFSLDW